MQRYFKQIGRGKGEFIMRLMVMGDFHYSRMESGSAEMLAARDEAFSTMLGKFLEWDADLHISLGDLTHEGHPEELEFVFDSIESSGRPFIHVLGNHDTLSLPKAEILTITGQQRYHAIDREEAMLLFIDTTKEMNADDWGGRDRGGAAAMAASSARDIGGQTGLYFRPSSGIRYDRTFNQ